MLMVPPEIGSKKVGLLSAGLGGPVCENEGIKHFHPLQIEVGGIFLSTSVEGHNPNLALSLSLSGVLYD